VALPICLSSKIHDITQICTENDIFLAIKNLQWDVVEKLLSLSK